MYGEPVRQRALAEILLQQEGLMGIKLPKRGHEFVQLRLNRASDMNPSLRGA
jgi:hypothetical protein